MEPNEPSVQKDLSNSVYDPAFDLSGYQYPELALVSPEFKKTLVASMSRRDACSFPVLLGDSSDVQVEDLFNRPNMLIAGTTGSGKTQFIYNQIAFWLFYKHPSQLKFIFCGSKSIDYNLFGKLEKHFLAGVDKGRSIVTPENFRETATALIFEIQQRIHLFTLAGVKTIKQYNALIIKKQLDYNQGHHYLPDIAVLIDDLYNFSYSEELDSQLILLTQQNSHTGIYVLAATSQVNSPSISRQLRSNFVLRVAFRLISQSDSKKILDNIGAEKLVHPGAMIYNFSGQLLKAQQPFIEYKDLQNLAEGIAAQKGYPEGYLLYNPNPEPKIDLDALDPLIDDAARLIVMHQQGSTSLIQRKLKLGYNRAGRMIDQLEVIGVVGPFEGSKAREVLIPDDYALEMFLNELHNPGDQSPVDKSSSIKPVTENPSRTESQETPCNAQLAIALLNQGPQQPAEKAGFWGKLKKLF
ncbi:DNA translocase FtsK [Pedobacter africanus]|uniref:S-DNA-T family DNA segregation ATPase FtsK/SpoIIIE n=1 Tax=Pedobacter africanus TaxID=151894 RepID=A0ACC6L433_9SPHI|nr:DNA translocase FtsK [Pedobacter africanus]MDR6786048.1 S-DNA-T family DNA segregation ATPase FtsK/SpoIIIE [Pedobacter africanus]